MALLDALLERDYHLFRGQVMAQGGDWDGLAYDETLDVVYALLVARYGREGVDTWLITPLPGSPEAEAAKAAEFNVGLSNIMGELGIDF